MSKSRRAARDEHGFAIDDLQDAVDRSTAEGGDGEPQRRNLRRAVERERAARVALERERRAS